MGTFQQLKIKDGKPVKPSVTTMNVNLTGVLYSTCYLLYIWQAKNNPTSLHAAAHLAIHYLLLNQKEGDLKSLIFIGSVGEYFKTSITVLLFAITTFVNDDSSISSLSGQRHG